MIIHRYTNKTHPIMNKLKLQGIMTCTMYMFVNNLFFLVKPICTKFHMEGKLVILLFFMLDKNYKQ